MTTDLNKPVTETMTLDRMTDIWARMTPEQKEVCAVIAFIFADGRLDYVDKSRFDEDPPQIDLDCLKDEWDKSGAPFQFGAVNGRRKTT